MKILEKMLKVKQPSRATHLAVLFRGRRIFGYAWNDRSKTKRIYAQFNFRRSTPHAEAAVILNFIKHSSKKELRKMSMIVIRYTLDGELKASKPCESCFRFMESFPVREIFWLDETLSLKKIALKQGD